jgi:hypothetical protein
MSMMPAAGDWIVRAIEWRGGRGSESAAAPSWHARRGELASGTGMRMICWMMQDRRFTACRLLAERQLGPIDSEC